MMIKKKNLSKILKKMNKKMKMLFVKKTRFQKIMDKLLVPFKKLAGLIKRFHLPRLYWKTGLFTFLLGTDLLAKKYVDEKMIPGETREYFDGNLKIRQVYNKGFILDTLDDKPEIVKNASLGVAGVLSLYTTWLMNQKGHLVKKLGMVFLDAGAASNIFDRIFRGKVVDYIGMKTDNVFLAKITANLADLYVFIGTVIASIGR